MKVVTFGELMIRLQPYNYERFVQADHLEFTFGGGEATVAVYLAEGAKCPRCWNHNEHSGTAGHHAELCPRCAAVVGE